MATKLYPMDFYFSQTYQESKRGCYRRFQFKDGCRMLPEQRGFAQLEDGQIVEFAMMQPVGRVVMNLPAWKAHTDWVFLGSGIFDHWEPFES